MAQTGVSQDFPVTFPPIPNPYIKAAQFFHYSEPRVESTVLRVSNFPSAFKPGHSGVL